MRAHLRPLFALTFLLGCGARTDLSREEDTPEPEPPEEEPACREPDNAAAVACGPMTIPLVVEQACEITRCAPLDAEVLVTLPSCDGCLLGEPCGGPPSERRVFAMNRLGRGHVAASCDATTAASLIASVRAFAYLGGGSHARVASVGRFPCNRGLEGATYLGESLPMEYETAEALAADFDVLVACGAEGEIEPADLGAAFGSVVSAFVRDEGGGLLALADYVCEGAAPGPALSQMNEVLNLAGLELEAANLGYGGTTAQLACVPDYTEDRLR